MTMPGKPGALNYRVTGISAGQYQQTAAGDTVQGHLVHLVVGPAQHTQVFVSDAQWEDPAVVQSMIEDAARKAAAVLNIAGTVG